VRAIAATDDTLAPSTKPVDGTSVRIPQLAGLLGGVELGTWALGPRSLEYVVSVVQATRPRLVLEFGSGASTLALAWAMHSAGCIDSQPCVISVDQDPVFAGSTLRMLARAGLGGHVAVVSAPLERRIIGGEDALSYGAESELELKVAGRSVDLVVIDGPAGATGIRFATLPLARQHVHSRAGFLLDDALRDGELSIARAWAAMPDVTVKGIRLVEKGILVGTVAGSS
jgi:predicted O-methyltransferase YrrM